MHLLRLTIPQQNIWNLQTYYSDTAISNICGAVFYNKKMDAGLLKAAINHVIEKQTALRMRFLEDDGKPVQYISEYGYEDIRTFEFDTAEEYEAFAKEQAQTPIGLENRKMYRFFVCVVSGRVGVLVTLSHLIADAWSFSLIITQIGKVYACLENGDEAELGKNDYAEYVSAEQEYLKAERYRKDEQFWGEKYSQKPEKSVIKPEMMQSKEIHAGRRIERLSEELCSQISAFAKENSITPAILYEAAVITYLHGINPQNHTVTIGIPVLNRAGKRERNTCGMFISTMPLTVEVNRDDTVALLLDRIGTGQRQVFRHQKYPFNGILRQVREKHGAEGNLYDVMFSYQNARIDADIDAETFWYSNGYSEIPLTLHIDNRDGRSSDLLTVDFRKEIFPQDEEIELLIERILFILEQITSDAELKIKDIRLLPDDERDILIGKFNDTYVEYDRGKCVHELFAEQVRKTPDHTALVFLDREFTYRRLDEMSNVLAHILREKEIGRGNIVPVIATRSWEIIVAMLGILKSGAAYMPLSPDYPRDRVELILKEAKSTVACVLGYDESFDGVENIKLDEAGLERDDAGMLTSVENVNEAEDLCYVIFTSGSTGMPKGVMIKHKNVLNYCDNNDNNVVCAIICENYNKVISVTNIVFDIFATESLLPLLNGMTIYLADDEEVFNQEKVNKIITENGIDVLQTTPTKMKGYLLDETHKEYLRTLKVIILGGGRNCRKGYVKN